MKEKKKKEQEKTENLVKELLEKLGFGEIGVEVKQGNEVIKVNLETQEGGILIGYHGEILGALQLILSLILYRQTGKWQRLSLDIGGYWQRRQEQLEQMALETAQRVKETGKSEALPFMSARERQIIHEALAESQEATTESIGEGRERRLVIGPK